MRYMLEIDTEKLSRVSSMTEEQYEAFRWLEHNVQQHEEILFLFGNDYKHSSIVLKHPHARISEQDMATILVTNFSYRQITPIFPRQGIEPKAIFNNSRIQSIEEPLQERLQAFSNISICDFDYYVFDKFARMELKLQNKTEVIGNSTAFIQNLVLFNIVFLEKATEKKAVTVVYMNDQVVIVKNWKKGKECV